MKCKNLHKDLIPFLEGELSPEKMEEIQNHLNLCSTCADFAKELKLTLGIIESEKDFEVNPYFYTRLKARLENVGDEQPSFFGRTILVRVVQPVMFSVLLILGVYLGIKIGEPASTKQYTVTLMQNQEIPYLNEMETETIESFLME